MNCRLAWFVTAADLALLLALAGCSGGGIPPATPAIGGAPETPAVARGAERAQVRFAIRIPKERRHRHARYVSPATESIALKISLGAKTAFAKRVNLTPGSPGCSAGLAGTVCRFAFSVKVANGYVASLTAYDGLNQTGNALSIGQSLAFDVKKAKLNTVSLTLNGIPKSIVVKQAGANSFIAAALDADGNIIVGPGAPAFAAARTSGSTVATIAQPTSSSPNRIGITLAGSPPAPPAVETIGVTASYPAGTANGCAQLGAVCSLASAATATYAYLGTFFTGDYGGGAVRGFTTPFLGTSKSPALSLAVPNAYAVGIGPNNVIFAADYSGGGLYTFAAPYTGAPVKNAIGAYDGYAIGFNSAGEVFVGSSSSVLQVAPPYSGAATTISMGVSSPYGIAFDSADNLYLANSNDTLGVYASGAYATEKYTVTLSSSPYSATRIGSMLYVGESSALEIFSLPITSSAATPAITISTGISGAYSVAFDSGGNLFVSNYTGSTVTKYAAPITSGEAPSVTLTNGLSGPCGALSFDRNGHLYVVNYSSGRLVEFAPPFTNASAPIGSSIAMGDICYGGLVSASAGSLTLSVP